MKNLYTILLGCCLLFPAYAREYDVIKNYIHISKNEGISNNHVKSIAEDRYGRLWIGTNTGLDIYDSKQLQQVEKYTGHLITCLFDTGREMLIATSEYIDAYDYESGSIVRVKDGTYDIGYILSVLNKGEDIILLSTEKIYQYKDKQLSLIKSDVPFTTLHIDKFGVLWGHASDVVYKLDDSFTIINSYQLVSDDFPR
ncbi:MAG: hypothetical protein LIP01_07040 [Tannerellaceae bacterium]|nr:hypothetical protein [Tannerellaceae bacterium]